MEIILSEVHVNTEKQLLLIFSGGSSFFLCHCMCDYFNSVFIPFQLIHLKDRQNEERGSPQVQPVKITVN